MNEEVDFITKILGNKYPGITFVNKTDTSYVFRLMDLAVIVRKASPYFPPKQELRRRINSSTSAKKSLGSLIGVTRQFLLESEKISLLVKEAPWIENLRRLNEYSLSSIFANPGMALDVRRLYLFTLAAFFATGRVYDFLGKLRTRNLVPNLIISDNLYVRKEGTDRLYVDADWYFKTSDTAITGFPLLSYYKRILIGLATYVCGYIFFLFVPPVYRIININKSEE